jgi:nicotinate-nucleotide pyrophosphorylase (carboxylating)
VEVDDLAGLDAAIAAGVGRVLLDNFTPGEAAMAVRRAAGRARIEISGGLVPGRLRPYAESGADFLSLGSLTHSARSVDLAMEMEALS